MARQLQQYSIIWYFNFETILVQFNALIYVHYTFLWFNFRFCIQHFCTQYTLVSFNAIASVQPFFLFQEQILRLTLCTSFNAIYFYSKIYCTAVDRNKLFPSLHSLPTRHFVKQRAVFSTNGSLVSFEVVVLPRGSSRVCEKDFR